MKINRLFLIVLDSFGIGALPDAARYGDAGSNTLGSIARSPLLDLHTLPLLGLYQIEGVSCGRAAAAPCGAYGRLAERSRGKDTTTGHWEIAGVPIDTPFPTYPDGFPAEVLTPFCAATGRGVLCNRPYSGTRVIRDYGRRQLETGDLIVYTSADSVFQVAAHEQCIPAETLYRYCEEARRILRGRHGVARVIARPFDGVFPDFKRTERRRDFSLAPPRPTLLDDCKAAGLDVLAVGKIHDIFAGSGVTETFLTHKNAEGMACLDDLVQRAFHGLCFVNLVDFDMLYGHRSDVDGYAAAMTRFDVWLGGFLPKLRRGDILMITGDHGCDPAAPGTDHSREYVPLLVSGPMVRRVNLGTRATFADLGKTAAALLGVSNCLTGASFAEELIKEGSL